MTQPGIVILHGKGDNGPDFARATGFDQAPALIAAPTGRGLAWSPAPYAQTTFEEDLARIDTLVDDLVSQGADPARIYLAGFSNGGGLAVHLSLASRRFAGVATVSAAVRATPDDIAACEHPVDYLNIHGTWDDVVPFAGEQRSPYSAAEDDTTYGADVTVEAFQRRNGGAARAELRAVEGMGHEWPATTTREILDFFGI